jgi:hypothetical protein
LTIARWAKFLRFLRWFASGTYRTKIPQLLVKKKRRVCDFHGHSRMLQRFHNNSPKVVTSSCNWTNRLQGFPGQNLKVEIRRTTQT